MITAQTNFNSFLFGDELAKKAYNRLLFKLLELIRGMDFLLKSRKKNSVEPCSPIFVCASACVATSHMHILAKPGTYQLGVEDIRHPRTSTEMNSMSTA